MVFILFLLGFADGRKKKGEGKREKGKSENAKK